VFGVITFVHFCYFKKLNSFFVSDENVEFVMFISNTLQNVFVLLFTTNVYTYAEKLIVSDT